MKPRITLVIPAEVFAVQRQIADQLVITLRDPTKPLAGIFQVTTAFSAQDAIRLGDKAKITVEIFDDPQQTGN